MSNDLKGTGEYVVVPKTPVSSIQSVAAGSAALGRAARVLQSLASGLNQSMQPPAQSDISECSEPGQLVTDSKKSEQTSAPPETVSGKPPGSALMQSAVFHRMVQRSARLKSKGGNKKWNYRSFECDLVLRGTVTGSSATFYAPVVPLIPNSSVVTEAVQLAQLFDEQKCRGVTVHARSNPSAITPAAWAFVYDAVDGNPYTSVAGTLVAGQSSGPIAQAGALGIQAESRSGYFTKRFTPPNEIAPTAGAFSAGETVGCAWYSSKDTNAVVGYLKFAADAITGGTVNLDYFIVFHMCYRERT